MIIFIQVLTYKFAKYVNISLKKWLQTSKYTAKANESMVKISFFFFYREPDTRRPSNSLIPLRGCNRQGI